MGQRGKESAAAEKDRTDGRPGPGRVARVYPPNWGFFQCGEIGEADRALGEADVEGSGRPYACLLP